MARLKDERKPGPHLENGRYCRINNCTMEDLAGADLTAAQLKICLAVLRLTWGYNKKEDRISYKQIQKLTGLSRQTISKEINRLAEYGVITKSSYKRGTMSVIGFQKYREWWKLPNRKSILKGFNCSTASDQSKRKKCSTTSDHLKSKCSTTSDQKCSTASDTPNTEIQNTNIAEKSAHAQVIDHYFKKFEKKFGSKPDFNGGKDGRLFQQILKTHGKEKTIALLDLFFEIKDDFIENTGYTVGVFKSQINKLIIEDAKRRKKKEEVYR